MVETKLQLLFTSLGVHSLYHQMVVD